jgi:hypothetical protein
MEAKGFQFRTPVRNFGELKYIMLEGPDRILIEVFEDKAAWHRIQSAEIPGSK